MAFQKRQLLTVIIEWLSCNRIKMRRHLSIHVPPTMRFVRKSSKYPPFLHSLCRDRIEYCFCIKSLSKHGNDKYTTTNSFSQAEQVVKLMVFIKLFTWHSVLCCKLCLILSNTFRMTYTTRMAHKLRLIYFSTMISARTFSKYDFFLFLFCCAFTLTVYWSSLRLVRRVRQNIDCACLASIFNEAVEQKCSDVDIVVGWPFAHEAAT